MKAVIAAILALCLVLTGCSAFVDGEYTWEASHPLEASPGGSQDNSAANYDQLYKALEKFITFGTEQGTIFVEDYNKDRLPEDLRNAVVNVRKQHPIAAYAVEAINYQLGTSGSKAALSVQIDYLHDKSEIRKIKRVADMNQAKQAVAEALIACETGIVMQIESYNAGDFAQMVEDYALENPQYVMELPQVTQGIYPEQGSTRVVELKFTYQTSRESLKNMQERVQPVFSSALLYVSGDGAEGEKLSQLYAFLMNRFDYKLKTSITPAYHLLRHGEGDSKAFAVVYAAMCRQAGLQCQVVSGTRAGEPWFWNIVCNDGVYYHVDLLRCKELGDYLEKSDQEMEGYVWDYEAYPLCGIQESEPGV